MWRVLYLMREAIAYHPWQSMAISGHQWPSVAIADHPWQSVAISGDQRNVPEYVTAHRLLIVAHLDVQMSGHVDQVSRTGGVSTTDDFGRTPIKGTHLQLAGVISGGSQCANQSLSKTLTCN